MQPEVPLTTAPTPKLSYWNTPKAFVLLSLLFLSAIGLGFTHNTSGLLNASSAILGGVLIDLPFAFFQKRKNKLPDGAILTGLIVAMVVSVTTPWYIPAATAALGVLLKNLLRVRKKPMLNPAAIGLLLGVLLLSTDQDWWGGMAELSPWWTLALLLIGFAITRKVNKYAQVLTFLGVYVLAFLVLALLGIDTDLASDALRTPFVNSALFLGFVMLTDPPTSPGRTSDQIVFALIAAVVSVALYLLWGGLAYLLIGLLTANLWNAWRLWKK
ncbi:RnfABCDGE type electron transport complex subunit D [Tumebacillus sp. ITR2]|uniref:RnfABCDGE type electron transport complex subunit D n=1 Tax=Tumebacillus amylolyticus TaxID=2801339 RepID=A0ABS1J4P5_9BACL|nr:RnfABCDGE type electron transport complex subunit D [Tumebacillus amylolyticus]MBL0385257.1 RnfABCDGE type electron transport complex subunit D [Tumebacillus amylolyticus]